MITDSILKNLSLSHQTMTSKIQSIRILNNNNLKLNNFDSNDELIQIEFAVNSQNNKSFFDFIDKIKL